MRARIINSIINNYLLNYDLNNNDKINISNRNKLYRNGTSLFAEVELREKIKEEMKLNKNNKFKNEIKKHRD